MCALRCAGDYDDVPCMVCGVADNLGGPGAALVCDRPGCDHVMHLACMDPPLTEVPRGDWFCTPACATTGMLPHVNENDMVLRHV